MFWFLMLNYVFLNFELEFELIDNKYVRLLKIKSKINYLIWQYFQKKTYKFLIVM